MRNKELTESGKKCQNNVFFINVSEHSKLSELESVRNGKRQKPKVSESASVRIVNCQNLSVRMGNGKDYDASHKFLSI